MKQIYANENYTVEQFNTVRFSISYNGDVVCKYDMTKESIKMMTEDLIEFMIEDKLIKRKEQNDIKMKVKASATMFMEIQKAKLKEEETIRKEKEKERERERLERLAKYGEDDVREMFFGIEI